MGHWRDQQDYNKALVMISLILLAVHLVACWSRELKAMNESKERG
jgi:hypothetical protein